MVKKLSVVERELLGNALAKDMGIYVIGPKKGIIQGERYVEILHEGQRVGFPSVKIPYETARRIAHEYEQKMQTVSNIILALNYDDESEFRIRGLSESSIYTIPMSSLSQLDEEIRLGSTVTRKNLAGINRITEEELYSLSLDELNFIKDGIDVGWEPGKIVFIPKTTSESEAHDALQRLKLKYYNAFDSKTLLGIMEDQSTEIKASIGTLRAYDMDIIDGSFVFPSEVRGLVDGYWDEVTKSATLSLPGIGQTVIGEQTLNEIGNGLTREEIDPELDEWLELNTDSLEGDDIENGEDTEDVEGPEEGEEDNGYIV